MATSCMEPPFKKLKKICVEKEIQQHNSEQQPPNISDEHISFGKDENNGKKVKEMFSEDFQAHPCYSSFSGCCIRKGHSTKVLINIQCQEKLVMEGIYFIKPLIGFANILGYNIPTGERQPIFSPRHRSLLSVTCGKLTAPAFDVDDHVYTCGCVVYTPEILSDLKKIYALSGSEMSSLHFSQMAPGILVEITRYESPLSHLLFKYEEIVGSPFSVGNIPLTKNGDSYAEYVEDTFNKSDYEATYHFSIDLDLSQKSIAIDKTSTNNNVSSSDDKDDNSIVSDVAECSEPKVLCPPRKSCDVLKCHEVLAGAKPILQSMEERPVVGEPCSWKKLLHSLTGCVDAGALTWGSGGSKNQHPGLRIVVVGSHGVGKSTFVRYFINSLINFARSRRANMNSVKSESTIVSEDTHISSDRKGSVKKVSNGSLYSGSENISVDRENDLEDCVCLMDIDPGQSEQTLPGTMAVSRVKSPLFGPSFIYGRSAFKSDAEITAADKKLRTRSMFLQHFRAKLAHQTGKTYNLPSSGSSVKHKRDEIRAEGNLSSAPGDEASEADMKMLNDLSEMVEHLEWESSATDNFGVCKELLMDKTNVTSSIPRYLALVEELMEEVLKSHSTVPLVVNTMGWIQDEGLLALTEIIKIVEPSIVIQITNVEDRKNNLLHHHNLNDFLSSEFYLELCQTERVVPADFHHRMKYNFFEVQSGVNPKRNRKKKRCPTKLTSQHLRDLNIICYLSSLVRHDEDGTARLRSAVLLDFQDTGLHCTHVCISPTSLAEDLRLELVALCCTDSKNLKHVGDDLPLTFEPPPQGCNKSSAFSRSEFQYPKGFSLLEEYPTLSHDIVVESDEKKKKKENFSRYYRKQSSNKMDSTWLYSIIGWGISLKVNDGKFRILTPVNAVQLKDVNLIVSCEEKLPICFKSMIFDLLEADPVPAL